MKKKTAKEIQELILDGLKKQSFVDWYEKEFVPNFIEESITPKEEVLEQIGKVFKIKDQS